MAPMETNTVTADSGMVWITDQAGDADLLAADDAFMFSRPGVPLLEAFSDDVLASFDA